ncbi:MAG: hypothetical protein NTV57_01625 [Cyanobacteria bacterium]|nr:hypothetical protein [Cyanobacteriota bacterium]
MLFVGTRLAGVARGWSCLAGATECEWLCCAVSPLQSGPQAGSMGRAGPFGGKANRKVIFDSVIQIQIQIQMQIQIQIQMQIQIQSSSLRCCSVQSSRVESN